MKLVQITTSVNWGAVGRIAEQIGNHVIKDGGESYIFYGRYCNKSESIAIKCTNLLSIAINLFCSRLFDMEGLSSWYNTKKVIRTIDKIKPDVIHIHNLHGYYFNYSVLFKYLNKIDTPVVWTFHDCWSFTGHCSHFVSVNCTKWKNECGHCPLLRSYPKSILFDGSKRNYKIKKKLFTDNKNLHVVAVSEWMAGLAHQSFFQGKDIRVINNGVDLNVFKPLGKIFQDQFKVLGVASVWSEKKGLSDFIRLREILDKSIFEIILVGLSQDQIKNYPWELKDSREQNLFIN